MPFPLVEGKLHGNSWRGISAQIPHLLLELLPEMLLNTLERRCDGFVQVKWKNSVGAARHILEKQQFGIRQQLQRPTLAPMPRHVFAVGLSV
eukprot:COSAG01_NODE_64203_length_277_cov_0.870787_1_plen_91_part_11